MTLYALPFQIDVKTKSSGVGGFTDGGCKCIKRDLTGPNFQALSVDVGPDPGKAWRSIVIAALAQQSSSVVVVNNGTNHVTVNESVVLEDGTVLGPFTDNDVTPKTLDRLQNSVFSGGSLGGVLSYPNKLRYTLQPLATSSPLVAPNGRVVLKLLVMEFDLLQDE